MKRLVTADTVTQAHASGARRLAAPRGEAVITPEAWSAAQELGVTLDQAPASSAGVVVVRGGDVKLAPFPAAPKVGLADVITARHGSPMTAGFMSWAREDSFPWTLDYDEIDLVLEGVLHVVLEGRTVEANVGDTVYIPKGSRITFGTPSRVKVFYVTYPADWAAASSAPARPQK